MHSHTSSPGFKGCNISQINYIYKVPKKGVTLVHVHMAIAERKCTDYLSKPRNGDFA